MSDKFGLTKDEISKKVEAFYKTADYDKDGQLSLVEFFISLPELMKSLTTKNEEKPEKVRLHF